MEQLVITIHPASSDEALLSVEDAMQQVLDIIRLHESARRAVAVPAEAFVWQLERASTNSPFQITARATPRNPSADVSDFVQATTREMTGALSRLIGGNGAAWWMEPETLALAGRVLERNRNGIGLTEIRPSDAPPVVIDRASAVAGVEAIRGIDVFTESGAGVESAAWGEIIGAMHSVGTYYKRPALRMLSRQYGYVWCTVTSEIVARFGHDKTLEDVWRGKTIGVEGKLLYGPGGRLLRIDASGVREIPDAPRLDIDSLYDPDFTGGLDPVEYLRRFHEGTLA